MNFSRALPLLAATALVASLAFINHPGMAEEVAKEDPSKEFTFIQMCDTQLGMGGYEHDVQTFELAVKQILEMRGGVKLSRGQGWIQAEKATIELATARVTATQVTTWTCQ